MTSSKDRVSSSADELRKHIQSFTRAFGLLADDRTPCGAPVGPREAHALMILLESERLERAPRQSELVSALGVDKSNVTRLIQRLSRGGRVQQQTDDADSRARTVRLTSKGRRLAESIERASRARFEALLRGIPVEKHELVLTALSLLNQANQKRSRGGERTAP